MKPWLLILVLEEFRNLRPWRCLTFVSLTLMQGPTCPILLGLLLVQLKNQKYYHACHECHSTFTRLCFSVDGQWSSDGYSLPQLSYCNYIYHYSYAKIHNIVWMVTLLKDTYRNAYKFNILALYFNASVTKLLAWSLFKPKFLVQNCNLPFIEIFTMHLSTHLNLCLLWQAPMIHSVTKAIPCYSTDRKCILCAI